MDVSSVVPNVFRISQICVMFLQVSVVFSPFLCFLVGTNQQIENTDKFSESIKAGSNAYQIC